MTPELLKQRLRGVIAFTPTPFFPDERVDFDALGLHIDRLIRGGAHAVVVCGGVGEYVSLSEDEYRECITVAVGAAEGRVPLLAGIGHSTRIACELAVHAARVGASGLMINPFSFIEPPDEGLVNHYRSLGESSGLGLMIFSTRGQVYGPDLVERLAEIDEVVALKDEWGDLGLFIETKERLGDRLAWINGMAETRAVPYFAAGAQAFTSGIVNFAPQLSLRVWELGSTGQFEILERFVAEHIRSIANLREKRKGYQVAVIKEAMHLCGYCANTVRSPLMSILDEDRVELCSILVDLGLLDPQATRKRDHRSN